MSDSIEIITLDEVVGEKEHSITVSVDPITKEIELLITPDFGQGETIRLNKVQTKHLAVILSTVFQDEMKMLK